MIEEKMFLSYFDEMDSSKLGNLTGRLIFKIEL